MKRNRLGRRGGLPRDAEQLLWLANGLADSSSRAEDHFWDQRLADAVDNLLRSEDEDALNTALDHLSTASAHAYDELADMIESRAEGEEVELAPRKINVYSLDLLEWAPPEAVIDVYCSSGTYVRSLANDLGKALGCGAYLVGLRRTKSGRFTLRDAVPLRKLREAFELGNWYQYLIPAAEALSDWPAIELDSAMLEAIRHGHRVPAAEDASGWARGVSEQGELVALLEVDETTHEWQPRKVFFS